jgi:hypothetical protein
MRIAEQHRNHERNRCMTSCDPQFLESCSGQWRNWALLLLDKSHVCWVIHRTHWCHSHSLTKTLGSLRADFLGGLFNQCPIASLRGWGVSFLQHVSLSRRSFLRPQNQNYEDYNCQDPGNDPNLSNIVHRLSSIQNNFGSRSQGNLCCPLRLSET